jgi:hypothetical protein
MGCGASTGISERQMAWQAAQQRGGGGGYPGAAVVAGNTYALAGPGGAPAYPQQQPGGDFQQFYAMANAPAAGSVGAMVAQHGNAGYPGAMAGYPAASARGRQGQGRRGHGPRRRGGGGGGGGGTAAAAAARRNAPQVQSGATQHAKNNFALHKGSLRLRPVGADGGKLELCFKFDADIAGEGEVFWGAVDNTPTQIEAADIASLGLDIQPHDGRAPAWFKFGPGSAQPFNGAALRTSRAMTKEMRVQSDAGVFPLVIRLRGARPGECAPRAPAHGFASPCSCVRAGCDVVPVLRASVRACVFECCVVLGGGARGCVWVGVVAGEGEQSETSFGVLNDPPRTDGGSSQPGVRVLKQKVPSPEHKGHGYRDPDLTAIYLCF